MTRRHRIGWLAAPAMIALLSVGALAADGSASALAIESTKAYGTRTLALQALATQSLWLAGGGLLVGLGVGIVVASVGTFLYKRRHIRKRLQS